MMTRTVIERSNSRIGEAIFAPILKCVLRTTPTHPQVSLVRTCCALVAMMFSLLVGVHCLPAMADDDDWSDFKSAKYHFTVTFPGEVKETTSKDTGLPIYSSVKDNCQYLVIIGDASKITGDLNSPDYLNSLWDLFKTGDKTATDPEDVSGDGWKGKTFKNNTDGKQYSGLFAVGKRGSFYCLMVDDATGTDNRNKFFDSLKADSDSSSNDSSSNSNSNSSDDSSSTTTSSSDSSTTTTTSSELDQQTQDAAYKAGKAVGEVLPWLILGFFVFAIFAAGIIVLVVWLVKRNNKQQ